MWARETSSHSIWQTQRALYVLIEFPCMQAVSLDVMRKTKMEFFITSLLLSASAAAPRMMIFAASRRHSFKFSGQWCHRYWLTCSRPSMVTPLTALCCWRL